MDLPTRLLELLAPTAPGDEIAPGARLVGASAELGLRLTFDLRGAEVHVEVERADGPRPHAARSRRLLFSYRVDGDAAQLSSEAGRALCAAVAARASRNEDRVLAAIEADALAAREGPGGAARVREVTVERLLEPAGSARERYFTLSPYVGCLIGCRFCYAQSKVGALRRVSLLPDLPWGSYVDARTNAAEVLARELAARPGVPVKFCPIVSDPYQAVEARYRLTRACLEVLRDESSPRGVMVLTRARLIERDADVLAALPLGFAGASLPTVDDEVRRHFEPRAASVDDRLAALATLAAAGVRTFAIVQPMLPGSIAALADALASRVGSVRVDVLEGLEGAAREFAHPIWRVAADPAWQRERAHELVEALRERGVAVWDSELPPELASRPGDAPARPPRP